MKGKVRDNSNSNIFSSARKEEMIRSNNDEHINKEQFFRNSKKGVGGFLDFSANALSRKVTDTMRFEWIVNFVIETQGAGEKIICKRTLKKPMNEMNI